MTLLHGDGTRQKGQEKGQAVKLTVKRSTDERSARGTKEKVEKVVATARVIWEGTFYQGGAGGARG
jgi:hypothetical protein